MDDLLWLILKQKINGPGLNVALNKPVIILIYGLLYPLCGSPFDSGPLIYIIYIKVGDILTASGPQKEIDQYTIPHRE